MIVQSLNLQSMPIGMVSQLPIQDDALLLGVTDVAGQPMLSYSASSNGYGNGPKVLIVSEYGALPDLPLRWVGAYAIPGSFAPTHVFEVGQ